MKEWKDIKNIMDENDLRDVIKCIKEYLVLNDYVMGNDRFINIKEEKIINIVESIEEGKNKIAVEIYVEGMSYPSVVLVN